MGERHGDAAIKWTLDNFFKDYNHKNFGQMSPFKLKSTVKSDQKTLRTYNFNFVDQHMLNQKYGDKSFTTYLGFDQSSATALIYIAKKIGLLRLLKFKRIYKIAETLLRNPKIGTDVFVVAIKSSEKILYASGHGEGRFTGLIAAEVAKRLVTIDLKKGLLDISDIISLDEVVKNELMELTFTTELT